MKILILEDDEHTSMLLEMLFERENTVLSARSTPEALRLLEEHVPDVAILDYLVYGDRCGSVVYALEARSIPFVILTAWRMSDVKAEFPHANAVILKPFDIDQLIHAVRSATK